MVVLLPRTKTVVLRSEIRPPTRANKGTHLNMQVNVIYSDIINMLNVDLEDIDNFKKAEERRFYYHFKLIVRPSTLSRSSPTLRPLAQVFVGVSSGTVEK